MQFRWVVLIALWTMLSGPILGPPTNSSAPAKGPTPEKVDRASVPR
jgi:hypothetical protein